MDELNNIISNLDHPNIKNDIKNHIKNHTKNDIKNDITKDIKNDIKNDTNNDIKKRQKTQKPLVYDYEKVSYNSNTVHFSTRLANFMTKAKKNKKTD